MSGDKVCFNSVQDLKDANELAEKIKNAQKKDKIVKDNRLRQIAEYAEENERLEKLLLTLTGGETSSSLSKAIEVFTDLLSSFDMDEPNFEALEDHLLDLQISRSTRLLKEENLDALVSDSIPLMQSNINLKETTEKLERKAKGLADTEAQMAKKGTFYKEKQKEYLKKLNKLETGLEANSVVEHHKIVQLGEALDEKQKLRDSLKAKLDSFMELPPDIDLAKLKVAEARKELESLTEDLTRDLLAINE